MTKEVKVLNEKQVKALVKAYVEYKKAENAFKKLKDELCKDIIEGKHESDVGYVLKTTSKRSSLDKTRLFEDHPEINEEEYLTEKEVTTITIQNLR